MRYTQDMINLQIAIINNKLKNTNKEVVVYSEYGYKTIGLRNKETTGEETIRTGLTNKEVYNCLYTYNELTLKIENEIKKRKEG